MLLRGASWFVRLQTLFVLEVDEVDPGRRAGGGPNTQANDAAGTEHAGVLVGVFAVVGSLSFLQTGKRGKVLVPTDCLVGNPLTLHSEFRAVWFWWGT